MIFYMPIVNFISPEGQVQEVDVPVGWSLMEAARRNGIEGVVAECGGGAICGTCHVTVKDDAYFHKLELASPAESALLEIVPEGNSQSRLACQIIMTEELQGMTVLIPSEQLDF